jgi:hypothetical protein
MRPKANSNDYLRNLLYQNDSSQFERLSVISKSIQGIEVFKPTNSKA